MRAKPFLLKPVSEDELRQAMQRSLKRLEAYKETHGYFSRIQEFIDGMHDMDQHKLIRGMSDIVEAILKLKGNHKGIRATLLNIFSGKLAELLKGPSTSGMPAGYEDNDIAIRKHFQSLAELWIQHVAQSNQEANW